MVRPYASHHFRPQAFLTMRELGLSPLTHSTSDWRRTDRPRSEARDCCEIPVHQDFGPTYRKLDRLRQDALAFPPNPPAFRGN